MATVSNRVTFTKKYIVGPYLEQKKLIQISLHQSQFTFSTWLWKIVQEEDFLCFSKGQLILKANPLVLI